MEITVDKESRVPIFAQIKNSVYAGVQSGALKTDDMLPSVRKTAQEHAINPNTVQKAYSQLQKEGVIYSLHGRGLFLSDCSSVLRELKKNELRARLAALTKEAKAAGVWIDELLEIVDSAYY